MSSRERCNGCGRWFNGAHGLRSHQAARFVTAACRPAYPAYDARLNIRQWSVALSGYDAGTYADGSGTRSVVGNLRTIKALDRRGYITWRTLEERGVPAGTHRPRPFLSPRGRAEVQLYLAAREK